MIGPDDLIIEQEFEEMENMTEGQLAEFLAQQAMCEPND